MLKLKMDKTLKHVTKDPKREEAPRKGREKYMIKLKKSILNDAKNGGEDTSNVSNDATEATTSVTISATGATTISSDTYIYINNVETYFVEGKWLNRRHFMIYQDKVFIKIMRYYSNLLTYS